MAKQQAAAVKEQEYKFGRQRSESDTQAKKNLSAFDDVPILLGEKRLLIPKKVFLGDNCPKNDISKMLNGDMKFQIQNGFLPVGNYDEPEFEVLVDFLRNPEECELPDESAELERVMHIAKALNVDSLIVKCREQRVINDADLNPVHVYREKEVPKWIQNSHKVLVFLQINFEDKTNTSSVSAVNHINLFFALGRILRRIFIFVYQPNSGAAGLRWEFVSSSKRIHLLEFTDEVEDEKDLNPPNEDEPPENDQIRKPEPPPRMLMRRRSRYDNCEIRSPSEGATDGDLTKTLPETFISILSGLQLRQQEKEDYLDIQWWYDILDSC